MVRCVTQILDAWGLTGVCVYSDQEPAILALINAIQAARIHNTVSHQGPHYDSKSTPMPSRRMA